jgi:DNA-binding Xre family transcriptional regulator
MGGMKEVRSNTLVLMAEKAQREQRRITLKKVADETGISYYTLNAIAHDTIREYPRAALASLCGYFGCDIGDLLTVVEVADKTEEA